MYKKIVAGALAFALVFGIGGTFGGVDKGVFAVNASAEEAETFTFTFIVNDKKVKQNDENYKQTYYTDDIDGNTYRVKVEKGKETNVNPSYFWLMSDDEDYFITFWKDSETGKVYSTEDMITADKDMTFEAVWKKKVTLTYINKEGALMPDESVNNGTYRSTRARDTRSSINKYIELDLDGPHAAYFLVPKVDDYGNEMRNESGDIIYEIKNTDLLGWRCAGDGSGKIYGNMEDFYPTKDETFFAVWYTGWNEDSIGKWYLNEDKLTYPVDCTIEIDGKTCKFDKAGYLVNSDKPDDEITSDDETTSEENDSVKPGDANGDNEINVSDIAVSAAHIKGIKPLTDEQQKAADVNNDDKVNVTDIAMIASHIKGIKALS